MTPQRQNQDFHSATKRTDRSTSRRVGWKSVVYVSLAQHQCDRRITIAGAVTLFTNGLSPGDVAVHDITEGPDGNVWFTEEFGNRIGSITPFGAITEYSNGISMNAGLVDITTGPDGNLWFTENALNQVGPITPGGMVTEFSAGFSPNASSVRSRRRTKFSGSRRSAQAMSGAYKHERPRYRVYHPGAWLPTSRRLPNGSAVDHRLRAATAS